jgi:hypothetical protein
MFAFFCPLVQPTMQNVQDMDMVTAALTEVTGYTGFEIHDALLKQSDLPPYTQWHRKNGRPSRRQKAE